MIKADLHMHTCFSMDSGNTIDDIVKKCTELKIDCVCICDHGTIEGAKKMKEIAPFKVIVAEEVLTPKGEIMGMFLKETIPSGTSVDETVARIKEQGGLVCIPHPIDVFRNSALETSEIIRLAENGSIDIIEVLNARTLRDKCIKASHDLSIKYGLPGSAGSDAHTISEIGKAFVEMEDFSTSSEFLNSLKHASIFGKRTGLLVHFYSLRERLKSIITG